MTLHKSNPRTGNTAEFKRRLLEKSLAMHAQAYLAQIKAKLLTQMIMQIENSKKNLQILNETLTSEIIARKQVEEHIQYMASHDDLTGLPNRALFRDRLEMAQSISLRQQSKLAVLFIDLDGFKAVNDNFGHKVGDLLLQTVAKLLESSVRQSDSVARIGGDEFIILLNSLNEEADAAIVAHKILAAFQPPILLDGHAAKVGASIGISLFPDHSRDTEKLIAYADGAMYKIKKSEKNAYAFHTTAESA